MLPEITFPLLGPATIIFPMVVYICEKCLRNIKSSQLFPGIIYPRGAAIPSLPALLQLPLAINIGEINITCTKHIIQACSLDLYK